MTRSLHTERGIFLLSLLWLLVAGTAHAQPSLLFYQNSQDQARSFDVDSLVAGPTVTGFLGAIVGNARNIQADDDDDLLWYADTSGNIRSKVVSTGADGPTPSSTLFLGANPWAERHFSIDPFDNTLYASGAAGAFRHLIYDPNSGLIYYSVTDGSVHSVDPATQLAGPTLSGANFSDITGAGRIITMAYRVLPEPDAALVQAVAVGTLAARARRSRARGRASRRCARVLSGAAGSRPAVN